jgi:predicted permease
MSAYSRVRSWWRAVAHRSAHDVEMEAELQLHIESYAADLVRQGIQPEDAARRARIELGPIAAQKENCRESLGLRPFDDLLGDIRYSFRQLRRTPAFTLTALVVLALGIGANAAMFSLIDATLLRQLPFKKPSELTSVSVYNAEGMALWTIYPDIQEWQAQSTTLASIGYYDQSEAFLETLNARQSLPSPTVSANLFSVLGVHPFMGRDFVPEEQVTGNTKVAILSYAVWRNLLNGDQQILGKQIKLDEVPHTVIGVMPPRFAFPSNEKLPQIWRPAEITSKDQVRDLTAGSFLVIARLRPGVTTATARVELSGIQQRLATLYTKHFKGEMAPSRVDLTDYRFTLVAQARPAVLALMAAVAVIWLIACVNIANLMLARGMARQREIAVRGALGASRWRIVRQLFTESIVLSIAGAISGLAIAQIALRVFEKALTAKLDLPFDLTPAPNVLLALLGLSILSAILFGLLPAFLSAKAPLENALRQDSSQAGASRGRNRLQHAMVIAEVGLSLVLLVACGLLLRTVFELRKVPLGFRTEHVLMLEPKLPQYQIGRLDKNKAILEPLLQRIQQMPDVDAAAITTELPLRKGIEVTMSFYGDGSDKSPDPPGQFNARLMASGPELKKVLAFRMYQGRYFTEEDAQSPQAVAVVNRAFANLYAPHGDIVDKFKLRIGKDRPVKIIGIMEDFHQTSIDRAPMPEIDFCAPQLLPTDGFYQPTLLAHTEIAIRISRDASVFTPALRRVIAEFNPALEASTIQTMDQVVEDSLGSQKLAAQLLELFAATALLVALSGLYGLLSYLVSQRTRELGVRLALGAQRSDIMRMLLSHAMRLLIAGAVAGIALAYVSSRLLAEFLYGVKPHDLSTMIGVTLLMIVCGFAAAYLPARKAARVDPMLALRGE